MKSLLKRTSIASILIVIAVIFSGCDSLLNGLHEHTFSKEWTYDSSYHWHKATCEHTEEISEKGSHSFTSWTVAKIPVPGEDGLQERECTVCKYKETKKYLYSDYFFEETGKKPSDFGSDILGQAVESISTIFEVVNNKTYSEEIIQILELYKNIDVTKIPTDFAPFQIDDLEKVTLDLGEKKKNDDNKYTEESYSSYSDAFEIAEGAINDYETSYEEYLRKKDIYKKAEAAYKFIAETAKALVNDFQDDFIFQGTYSFDDLAQNIDLAENINTKESEYFDAKSTASAYQEIAEMRIEAVGHVSLNLTQGGQDPGSGEDPQGEDPQGEDPQGDPVLITITFDSQNADIQAEPDSYTTQYNYLDEWNFPKAPTKDGFVFDGWYTMPDGKGTKFTNSFALTEDITVYAKWISTSINLTLGDTLPTDWANIEHVTLALPAETTEIDVVSFARYKNLICEKFENQKKLEYDSDITVKERTLSFADYPTSATKFKLDIASSGKSNTDLMKEFVNPKSLDFTSEKTSKTTEIIPGVNVVTYARFWFGKGNYDNEFLQSFEFTENKNNTVIMPSQYNLTDTYKGGIIGNVEFTNLGSTTVSGELLGKNNIENFYNVFVKNKQPSELATLNLIFTAEGYEDKEHSIIDNGYVNLYKTKVDELVKSYVYNDITRSKFDFKANGAVCFNTESSLNGGSMYDGNSYSTSEVGTIDINTVMLLDAYLANIKVNGTNKQEKNQILTSGFRNVQFATDMSGINLTGSAKGVIEFMDDAPASLEGAATAYIHLKKVTHETTFGSINVLDVTGLTSSQISNIKAKDGRNTITEVIGSSAPSVFYVVDGLKSQPTYSKQQYESAANQGKHPENLFSKLLPEQNATNSNLLRAVLDGKQKQYS